MFISGSPPSQSLKSDALPGSRGKYERVSSTGAEALQLFVFCVRSEVWPKFGDDPPMMITPKMGLFKHGGAAENDVLNNLLGGKPFLNKAHCPIYVFNVGADAWNVCIACCTRYMMMDCFTCVVPLFWQNITPFDMIRGYPDYTTMCHCFAGFLSISGTFNHAYFHLHLISMCSRFVWSRSKYW